MTMENSRIRKTTVNCLTTHENNCIESRRPAESTNDTLNLDIPPSYMSPSLNHFVPFVGTPKIKWPPTLCDAINTEGDIAYSNGNYHQAYELYGQALSMCPNSPKFITNRSACSMKLSNYEDALTDALRAIDLDDMYIRAYSNAINIFLILGKIKQAETYIVALENNNLLSDSVQFNELTKLETLKKHCVKIDELYEQGNYQELLNYLNDAMKIATHCEHFENLQAECLVMLKQYNKADVFINEKLQKNPNRPHLVLVKGLKAYISGNFEQSVAIFDRVLNMHRNFDFTRARALQNKAKEFMLLIKKGKDAMAQRRYEEAKTMFTRALYIDPIHTKINGAMFFYRGRANFQLQYFKLAYADFTEALKINRDSREALVGRAHCRLTLGELENCLSDCEELLRIDTVKYRDDIVKLAEKAKLRLQSAQPYPVPSSNFEILKVSVNKTVDEKVLSHFSDKNPNKI